MIREWRPVIKGVVTMVPGVYSAFARKRGGGTASAEYCFSVWLKHLTMLKANGMAEIPNVVAELGPGHTLGVGICALLSGADRYYALDAVRYSDTQSNLRLLDDCVALFRSRAKVPAGWPDISQHLDEGGFPHVLTPALLENTLREVRIESIRNALLNRPSEITVKYIAPWDDVDQVARDSIDLILSQSVLEHVTDIERTIGCCAAWLKPDGWMSHVVDFKSHGVTKEWNGHWQYPHWAWRLIVGGRPYLINRIPADALLAYLENMGFHIAMELRSERPGGLPPEMLHADWRTMAVNCSAMYFQARLA